MVKVVVSTSWGFPAYCDLSHVSGVFFELLEYGLKELFAVFMCFLQFVISFDEFLDAELALAHLFL